MQKNLICIFIIFILFSNSKYKMIHFDDVTRENKIIHNPDWSYILDYPYRILIVGGSGSGKTNPLLNIKSY